MKVEFHVIGHDPYAVKRKGEPDVEQCLEEVDAGRDGPLLDGPVARRLATVDFDPETGDVLPGVRVSKFRLSERHFRRYIWSDKDGIEDAGFIRTNCFGLVLSTMRLFEEPGALGRKMRWGFNGKQLLIVPRAGEYRNAYYQRESRSLQFFFCADEVNPEETVFTGLSRDIVAHEAGHAILDGIAPDLYDAFSPQSLALHEGVADLTAMWMALEYRPFCRAIIEAHGGIDKASELNAIGEQFARRDRHDRLPRIRSLLNDSHLQGAGGESPRRYDPYALSLVLSGALYNVLSQSQQREQENHLEEDGTLSVDSRVLGLADANDRCRRMAIRGLDYLPPGEATFADYGRAIVAADRASYPERERERQWLKAEFVARGIVPNSSALHSETNVKWQGLRDVDFDAIVRRKQAARDFVNQNRKLFCIPANTLFTVKSRINVTKRDGDRTTRECLLKVAWERREPNPPDVRPARDRAITVGTTVAIDLDRCTVQAALTSDPAYHKEESDEQKRDRDLMLSWLTEEGLLRSERCGIGPDGRKLQSVVTATAKGNLLRVRGTGAMLHVIGAGRETE